MNINRSNYESWFLDYHEGILPAEKAAELFLFLEQHPELKAEFESFELFTLENTNEVAFPDKQSLKKSDILSAQNINEWLVADLEGDLNLQQKITLNAFLANNPQFNRDKELFGKSKLTVNYSEQYPDKSELRKGIKEIPMFTMRTWYAVAASILILVGAWITFIAIHQAGENQTAGDKRKIEKPLPVKTNDINNIQNNVENKIANNKVENNPEKTEKENSSASNTPSIQFAQEKSVKNNSANQKNNNKVKTTIPAISVPEENMAFIESKPLKPIAELEPFVFAERKYNPGTALSEKEKSGNNTASNNPDNPISDIKEFAVESVNKVAGKELIASNESNPKLPLKSKLIRFAGNFVNKISQDHIKVKTTFDPINGNIAAYQVEMGKSKWQKQF